MTENEALNLMRIEKECINRDCDRNCFNCDIVQEVDNLNSAYDVAIKALEEVQRYRATTLSPEQVRALQNRFADTVIWLGEYMIIGTPEEFRIAIAKQADQTPDLEGGRRADGHIVYDTWICPGCGEHYEVEYDKYEYCPHCGQKISWEDGED